MRLVRVEQLDLNKTVIPKSTSYCLIETDNVE